MLNDCKFLILALLTGANDSGDLVLRLFRNNISPGINDDITDFVEANTDSYSSVSMASANWSITVDSDNVVLATHPPVLVEITDASSKVYGYYITDADETHVVSAARFTEAPVLGSSTFHVIPRISLV